MPEVVIERVPEDCFRGVLDTLSRGGTLLKGEIAQEIEKLLGNLREELKQISDEDIQKYLKTGESRTEYFPQELINTINSNNIGEMDYGILFRLCEDEKSSKKLLQCITKDNISQIDEGSNNILWKIAVKSKDNIKGIVNCITEKNLTGIHWYTIEYICSVSEESRVKMLEFISSKNQNNIDRRVLVALKYGNIAGKILRELGFSVGCKPEKNIGF